MTAELWKPIPGYEGIYAASDQGRIKSLARVSRRGRLLPDRILKAQRNPANGYLQVSLTDRGGRQVTQRVHVLVATAFHGPRPRGLDACHGDGDRLNNTASNLRWDTRSNNILDAVQHGTHVLASATACKYGHPFDENNTTPRADGGRRCRTCSLDRQRRRAPTTVVREWAASHGFKVSRTGILSAAVKDAYAAAHPGEVSA